MRLILPFITLAAWWSTRHARRAAADFRRATYYVIRAESSLVAAGRLPSHLTDSGVPVMAKLPLCR